MTAIDWTSFVPPWPPSLQFGKLITDEQLVIRYWCPWLERQSGRPATEVQGRGLFELFPELNERGMSALYKRALAGEAAELRQQQHSYLIPLPLPTPAGSFRYMQQRAQIAPLELDGRVVGTISILFDLTEQALEAEAARQLRVAAEEALRIRDTFFSLAAHELRTPLTTLLGRAQLLQKWLGDTPRTEERVLRSVAIVVEQAKRLNAMLTALLDVSRIQTGRFSIVTAQLDLCKLVQRTVEEIYPTPSTHELQLELPPQPLPVEGDESRLEQVLLSLIGNAVKYSPQGGRVRVRLRQDANEAQIVVSDNGIGIPVEAQEDLFRRFYRAENAERLGISGLGVGLFTAHEILELHGGRIKVESIEGQGSSFTVSLPLATREPSQSPGA
jgi:signal transduction histidine kinase